MKSRPRLFKAHAQVVADELTRQGWILRHEFRTDEDEEPYEFILEWARDEEPPAIDPATFAPPTVAKEEEPNQTSQPTPLKRRG